MVRVRRAVVALAGLIGFALGFVVTFLIGIEVTGSAACDGPCFEKWDEVAYVGLAVGAAAAIALALGTHALVRALGRRKRASL